MLALFDGPDGVRETLRFIEEQEDIGLWRLDLRTRELKWSRGFYALLGLEPGSVRPSSETLQSFIHPEDTRPPGEMEAMIAQGGAFRREFRIIQRNGRVRWISSRCEVLLDREGLPWRVIGISADVTRQHEMRTKREMVQARFAALVDALGGSAWMASADGKATDVLGWCEMTGQSKSEAAGDGWLDAVHPDDRDGVREAWREAVQAGKVYEKEYRLRLASGAYRWIRCRAAPVCKAGRVLEWVGLTLDIQREKVWPTPENAEYRVTGAQLRAARALLNWSVKDLAECARVSAATIRRLEEVDSAPKTREAALAPLKSALEQRGVDFLFPPLASPTVALRAQKMH